jgi:hypothetical protein
MEAIPPTDYLAAIFYPPVVSFVEPDNKTGKIRGLSSAVIADVALAALMVATAIIVALVICNWSR